MKRSPDGCTQTAIKCKQNMQSKDYDVIANQSNQINQNNNAVKTMTYEIRYIFIFECHFESFVGNTYFFYTTFSNFLCTGHHNTADDPAAGGDCYRARHDPVRRPRLLHIHQVDLQASFHQHLHLRGNTESPEVADGRAAFKASITTM